MRGVTSQMDKHNLVGFISTHTPHARRDLAFFEILFDSKNFNSHASCEA